MVVKTDDPEQKKRPRSSEHPTVHRMDKQENAVRQWDRLVKVAFFWFFTTRMMAWASGTLKVMQERRLAQGKTTKPGEEGAQIVKERKGSAEQDAKALQAKADDLKAQAKQATKDAKAAEDAAKLASLKARMPEAAKAGSSSASGYRRNG